MAVGTTENLCPKNNKGTEQHLVCSGVEIKDLDSPTKMVGESGLNEGFLPVNRKTKSGWQFDSIVDLTHCRMPIKQITHIVTINQDNMISERG